MEKSCPQCTLIQKASNNRCTVCNADISKVKGTKESLYDILRAEEEKKRQARKVNKIRTIERLLSGLRGGKDQNNRIVDLNLELLAESSDPPPKSTSNAPKKSIMPEGPVRVPTGGWSSVVDNNKSKGGQSKGGSKGATLIQIKPKGIHQIRQLPAYLKLARTHRSLLEAVLKFCDSSEGRAAALTCSDVAEDTTARAFTIRLDVNAQGTHPKITYSDHFMLYVDPESPFLAVDGTSMLAQSINSAWSSGPYCDEQKGASIDYFLSFVADFSASYDPFAKAEDQDGGWGEGDDTWGSEGNQAWEGSGGLDSLDVKKGMESSDVLEEKAPKNSGNSDESSFVQTSSTADSVFVRKPFMARQRSYKQAGLADLNVFQDRDVAEMAEELGVPTYACAPLLRASRWSRHKLRLAFGACSPCDDEEAKVHVDGIDEKNGGHERKEEEEQAPVNHAQAQAALLSEPQRQRAIKALLAEYTKGQGEYVDQLPLSGWRKLNSTAQLTCLQNGVVYALSGSTTPFWVADAKRNEEEFCCEVCFGEYELRETIGMHCGHRLCKECFTEFLNNEVENGVQALDATCPTYGCRERVPPQVFRDLLPAGSKALVKFDRAYRQSYVGDSDDSIWCPRPGCGRAVLQSQSRRNVYCDRGHPFCFQCQETAHAPCSCDEYARWKEKDGDVNLSELVIMKKTKPCPFCKTRTEKNGGCMYMTCGNCKKNWCWHCGKGDHHVSMCGRKEVAKLGQGLTSTSKDHYSYYHFLERFKNHEESMKLLANKRSTAMKLEEQLLSDSKTDDGAAFLVHDSLQFLMECHNLAKWLYAKAYFMDRSNAEENRRQVKEIQELASSGNFGKAVNKWLKALQDPLVPAQKAAYEAMIKAGKKTRVRDQVEAFNLDYRLSTAAYDLFQSRYHLLLDRLELLGKMVEDLISKNRHAVRGYLRRTDLRSVMRSTAKVVRMLSNYEMVW